MSVYISKPAVALPRYQYVQDEILDFMVRNTEEPTQIRKLQAIYKESGIETRHSVLPDFKQQTNPDKETWSSVRTPERMKIYVEQSLTLGIEAVQRLTEELALVSDFQLTQVTHLVWVSCTGLTAPGIETLILSRFDFHPKIQSTAFNFMGCHGFFHALRYASGIVNAQPEANVLVLCVELCTLHFKAGGEDDQLLANSLFADGAAATLISGKKWAFPEIQVVKQSQSYFPTAADHMAWKIGEFGFDMMLSRKLPQSVSENIEGSISKLLRETSYSMDFSAWIIHPGGKRILDLIQKIFGLEKENLIPSRQVLQSVGNVSSASVLFALRNFMNSASFQPNHHGILLGIGPGLAIESALFVY